MRTPPRSRTRSPDVLGGTRFAAAVGMRSVNLRSPSFAIGFTLGLALTGVTFALGRVVQRRFAARPMKDLAHPVIDGAKPIDPVKLEIGPDPEPGAGTIRLESEIEDPPINSQRW
jgi:hypothetical protein